MTHRDLLARVIAASGLSASAFARDVLLREPRTIRRWLAGDSPIPAVVGAWLTAHASARDKAPDVLPPRMTNAQPVAPREDTTDA
jgi:hypothetical protein